MSNRIRIIFKPFISLKVHTSEQSQVEDHCVVHALSDPKEEKWCLSCDHTHDLSCSSCKDLKVVLSSIKEEVQKVYENLASERGDDLMFACQQAIQAIDAWKSHQLRSLRQDKSRTDMINELDESTVMITQDWAMKFLPEKYRETQTDWFGKRGISWHISVVVIRSASGELKHQTFVHIAKNCSQDSDAVVSIMEHTLRHLKSEHPEVTSAAYKQDNAGCYHSTAMITACHYMEKETGIRIKRVDFSDPQGGKGPCDRKAATIKAHIRRYINEGNDVTSAEALREAILSYGGVRGVRVAVIDAAGIQTIEGIKLVGINSLNNFKYSKDSLTMWKSYDIGEGKSLEWTKQQGS